MTLNMKQREYKEYIIALTFFWTRPNQTQIFMSYVGSGTGQTNPIDILIYKVQILFL